MLLDRKYAVISMDTTRYKVHIIENGCSDTKYSANSNKLHILNDMSENWNTTLERVKLQVLLNMYASRKFDPDDASFDDDIEELDNCRDVILRGKPLANYDADNAIMCSSGHEKVSSRNSCVDNCSINDTDEDVIIDD